jgi:hypothetical protein
VLSLSNYLFICFLLKTNGFLSYSYICDIFRVNFVSDIGRNSIWFFCVCRYPLPPPPFAENTILSHMSSVSKNDSTPPLPQTAGWSVTLIDSLFTFQNFQHLLFCETKSLQLYLLTKQTQELHLTLLIYLRTWTTPACYKYSVLWRRLLAPFYWNLILEYLSGKLGDWFSCFTHDLSQ